MTQPAAIPFADALGSAKLKIKAFDGSVAGADVPIGIRINSPRAAADLLQHPGEVGLARAFASGDMSVFGVPEGDPYEVLAELEEMGDHRPTAATILRLSMVAGREMLHLPRTLSIEMPPRWRRLTNGLRHSKARDAEAIRHHYDVSNEFYAHVLGPSMTYTCAVFDNRDQSLTDAQENKYRLVFDKLRLQPGDRLLDVGCGWGGMVKYAAQQGVQTLGVTLSKSQAEWGQQAIAEAGLTHLAEIRYLDYRDVPEDEFDAVSSIGLTEHIGLANYPDYFGFLHSRLRDGGLLLNHCITRPDNHYNSHPGGFMDRFVFPDAELASPGRVISSIHDQGFEVRHEENLREHYALTLTHWNHNLAAHWDECCAEAGISKSRIWAIYLAGSRLGFEQNDLQLHQVLGVKGRARLPLRPWWKP